MANNNAITAGSYILGGTNYGGTLNALGQSLFGSKKSKGPSIQDQIYAAGDMAYEQLNGKLKAASYARERYGIHPLAALGVSSGGGSLQFPSGNDRTLDLEQMGQGVQRALNAGRTGVQKKLDNLALEKAQLSNDYLKVQIAGAQKAISNTADIPAVDSGLPRNSSTGQNSGGINDYLKSIKSNKLGIEDGYAPRHKVMVGDDGRPVRVLNTDVVGDNEVLMFYDALTNTFPDEVSNAFKRTFQDNRFYRWYKNRKKPIRSYR